MKLFKNQRGDTIVEVMIVVAVLSLILTVSFVTVNRSTQGNRQAQEHSEASKYAESQIELLKTYLSQGTEVALPPNPSNFCMKENISPTDAISGPVDESNDFAAINGNDDLKAACKKTQGGGEYYSYIERSGDGNKFTARTSWYNATGNGTDRATMVYRIYPDLASGNLGDGIVGVDCVAPGNTLNQAGGCEPCPNGFASSNGYTRYNCKRLPPKIIAHVKKIEPDGNNTPSCTKAATGTRANTDVKLSRIGLPPFNQTTSTNSSSDAVFSGLAITEEGDPFYSYDISVSDQGISGVSRYEVCPAPSPQTERVDTTDGPFPAVPFEKTVEFTVRPICDIATFKLVNMPFTTFDGPRTAYWDQHLGGSTNYFTASEKRAIIWSGNFYYARDDRFNRGNPVRGFYNLFLRNYYTVFDAPVSHDNFVSVFDKFVCPT